MEGDQLFWLAQDCPAFKTERPTSWETLQSKTNMKYDYLYI